MRTETMIVAILASILVGNSLAIAEPAPNDNEAIQKVATQALEAMKVADWQGFASLMHTDALREFKDTIAPAIEEADAESSEMRQVMALFGNPKNVKEILALSPEKFFVRFLEGATKSPQLRKAMSSSSYQIIGILYEKDGTAHFVYRMEMKVQGESVRKVDVISLKQEGKSWRMLTSGDFKNAGGQLRRGLKK